MDSITERVCRYCGESKAIENFSQRMYESRLSISRQCISCRKKRQRVYRERNREKINAHQKKWWASNADKQHEKNKKNRAQLLESERRYRKENPEYNKVKCSNRKARRVNAAGSYTKQEWESLLEKYGNQCLKCHSKDKITADHILPLSRGGSNFIINIQPLCLSCNSSKLDSYADYRPESDRAGLEELERLGTLFTAKVSKRIRLGVLNPKAKLTDQDVIKILQSKEPTRVLAKKYGMNVCSINSIRAGKTWRHIEGDRTAPHQGKPFVYTITK